MTRIEYLVYLFLLPQLLSGPIGYYFNISDRLLTVITYIILSLFIFLNMSKLKKVFIPSFMLISYSLLRFPIELIFHNSNILQPLISILETMIFALLIWILYESRIEKSEFVKVYNALFNVFLITVIISFIQFFKLPSSEIFSQYGGNITSSNVLGWVRVNGGISGTPIDYSYFISLVILFFFDSFHELTLIKKMLSFVCIIIMLFFNFSRASFLTLLIVIIIYSYKNITINDFKSAIAFCSKIIIGLLLIIGIAFGYYKINSNYSENEINLFTYIFYYDQTRIQSDQARIEGWKKALYPREDSFPNARIGNSLGLNTGFPTENGNQTGASHLIGFLADHGVFGLFFYLSIYFSLLLNKLFRCISTNNLFFYCSYVILLLLVQLINSGIEHHINYFLTALLLVSIFGSDQNKSQRKVPSLIMQKPYL